MYVSYICLRETVKKANGQKNSTSFWVEIDDPKNVRCGKKDAVKS